MHTHANKFSPSHWSHKCTHTNPHTHSLSLCDQTETHTHTLSDQPYHTHTNTISLSDQSYHAHTHSFSLWLTISHTHFLSVTKYNPPPPPHSLCNWLHPPPPKLIIAIWWAVYLWPAGITLSRSGEACSSLQWLLKMISVWVSYFSSVHVIWSSLLRSNAVQFKLVSQHPRKPISTVWVQGHPLTCCLRKVKDI